MKKEIVTLLIFTLATFFSCTTKEKEYYQNGNLKKIVSVKNGEVHGVVKIFYPNGNVQELSYFENGKRNGISKGFFNTGELQWMVLYLNDIENGKYEEYYKNGNLKYSCYFINGIQDSLLTEYYENGNIKAVQYFDKGIKQGLQESYFDNGQLKLIATWDANSVVYYKKYNLDGTLSKEYRDILLKPQSNNISMGDDYNATIFVTGSLSAKDDVRISISIPQKMKVRNKNKELKQLRNNTKKIQFTPGEKGEYFFCVEIQYVNEKGLHSFYKEFSFYVN